MPAIPPKILNSFRKVRQIQNDLWGEGHIQGRELSVDDVAETIGRLFDFRIEMSVVTFEAEHVVSLIERWPDHRAAVYVRFDTPATMKRYAAIKELCHLIADEPDDFETDYQSTLEGLLYAHTLGLTDGQSNNIRSERLAEVLADELLYDFRRRYADSMALKDTTETMAGLALKLKLSQAVVSRALRPLRMELIRNIWAEVDAGIADEKSR